jgi:hypothetical protein
LIDILRDAAGLLDGDNAAGEGSGHAGLRGGGFAVGLAEGGGAGERGGSEEIAAVELHRSYFTGK